MSTRLVVGCLCVPSQFAWQVTRGKTEEEMAGDVQALLGGDKPDVTIECSGVEASIRSDLSQLSIRQSRLENFL